MIKKRGNHSYNLLIFFALFIFALHSIFIFTGFIKINSSVLGNIFIMLLSLLSLISVFVLYLKFPSNFIIEKRGRLFLIISLTFFFLGDLFWTIYQTVLKNILPLGGIPDLCWNFAYLALMVSLVFFIKIQFRPSNLLAGILFSLGIFAGLIYLYFDLSEDIRLGTLNFIHLIQDLYFFYDFILLALVFVLIFPLINLRNKFFIGWIIIGIGITTRIVYDIFFANMSEKGIYYTGHPIDLIYVLFYLSIIFNSWLKFKILNVK